MTVQPKTIRQYFVDIFLTKSSYEYYHLKEKCFSEQNPQLSFILLVKCCFTCYFQLWSQRGFIHNTGELGYDGPLYDGFLHMTDNMLGPSPMHIKYLSCVYDGFCIWRTNFPGPIESVISKFICNMVNLSFCSGEYPFIEMVERVFLHAPSLPGAFSGQT